MVLISDRILVNGEYKTPYRMNANRVYARGGIGGRSDVAIVPSPICPLRDIDEKKMTALPEDKSVSTQHRIPSMAL